MSRKLAPAEQRCLSLIPGDIIQVRRGRLVDMPAIVTAPPSRFGVIVKLQRPAPWKRGERWCVRTTVIRPLEIIDVMEKASVPA